MRVSARPPAVLWSITRQFSLLADMQCNSLSPSPTHNVMARRLCMYAGRHRHRWSYTLRISCDAESCSRKCIFKAQYTLSSSTTCFAERQPLRDVGCSLSLRMWRRPACKVDARSHPQSRQAPTRSVPSQHVRSLSRYLSSRSRDRLSPEASEASLYTAVTTPLEQHCRDRA